ncbi:MAG: DnaB-like helicase N-terminal domain-containing protein, partial [Anaerolineaceae bacterium]
MSDQDQYSNTSSDLTPGQLFDRAMEEALIGAVLINPDVFLDVASILNPEDFYFNRHQWIWESFQTLYSTEQSFDLLTVNLELEAHNHAEDVGGTEYLAGLANQVPSSL